MQRWFFLGLFLVACSQVKDINKVSSHYVDKQELFGEWYHRASIVDKQYHNSSFFIGIECELDRVRFEITKDKLIAYRSYEKAPNTNVISPSQDMMIAAFPILKHFDIRRAYNAQNGIENNIIEENTERPWWQRKHMQVDWSTNLIPTVQCNDLIQSQTLAQIPKHEQNDLTNAHRFRKEKDYFETTLHVLAQPDKNACQALEDMSCFASEVKMKFSFKKVPEINTYQSMEYPDDVPIKMGKNEQGKDCVEGQKGCEHLKPVFMYQGPKGPGLCDPLVDPMENCSPLTLPLFKRFGFFRTERIAYDRELGFAQSNRRFLINRWNFPKPIIYYLNVDFPDDLQTAAMEMASDWNNAFVDAAAAKMNLSKEEVIKRYGQLFQIKPNDCRLENIHKYIKNHNLQALLQENGIEDVEKYEREEVCAALEQISKLKNLPPFDWQRLGDLRYSFVNYTKKAELAGPLGYGPSASDPLTGEIISAAANIYGPSLDMYAAQGADVVAYLNGDEQIAKKYTQKTRVYSDPYYTYLAQVRNHSFQQHEDVAHSGFVWDRLDLRPIETYLVPNEPWMLQASPLQLIHPSFSEKWLEKDHHERFLGERGLCFSKDVTEPAVLGLAKELKGKTKEEAYATIRASIFKAVTAHELGHTFGLRHNFEGSLDALNFFPNFWGVETKDHRETKLTQSPSEMKYSSIMDYHQRFNSDFAGIGLYDKAAILMGYGGHVEIFDESSEAFVPKNLMDMLYLFYYQDLPSLFSGGNVEEEVLKLYRKAKTDRIEGNTEVFIDVKRLNLPKKPENFYKRKWVPFEDYKHNYLKNMVGLLPQGEKPYTEVPYRYCSDAYAFSGSLTCNRWDMGANPEEIVSNAIDMYHFYYLFNAFKRDRMRFSPASYLSRIYSRVYMPAVAPFKYLYQFKDSSARVWPLLHSYEKATYLGLSFLHEVLQTVEPGRYCLQNNQYRLAKEGDGPCENPLEVPLGEGKPFESTYTHNQDYKVESVGHFWDKLLALRALTEHQQYSGALSKDMLIGSGYVPNYYNLFTGDMSRLFGAWATKDVEGFSPRVEMQAGKPQIIYQSPIKNKTEMSKMAALPLIEATHSSLLRQYALLLSMAHYTHSSSPTLDFAKQARVMMAGSENDGTLGAEDLRFKDPFNHVTYHALIKQDNPEAVGFQLVKKAHLLVNDGKDGKPKGPWYETQERVKNLEKEHQNAQKDAASATDVGDLEESLKAHQQKLRQLEQELNEEIQILDFARKIGDMLEYSR